MPLCFTFTIIKYRSRVKGVINKECPILYLRIVPIEKEAFVSPLITVGQIIYDLSTNTL